MPHTINQVLCPPVCQSNLHVRHLADAFCPKRLTVIHLYIHALMAVAAIQGADQHIRNSSGDSILPKDTAWQGESNQRHSDYKILALPLSQCRQSQSLGSVSHSVLILYGMWNRFWIIPRSDVTQWTGCIVGNVGTRFWKVRRMCRLNKGDISGSAVLILIICLYTCHDPARGRTKYDEAYG